MPLEIEAIKFNHDSLSATHDALTIRVNYSVPVEVPEWRRGVSIEPEDSPAAYAIGAVGDNTITIQARFRMPEASSGPFSIRARSVKPCNPLGDVAPATVRFGEDGFSDWVTFDVTGQLGCTVRATDITWRWEVADPQSDSWVPFAATKHRIYVLLDMPTGPWTQSQRPDPTQLPWTEVFDVACRWAAEASTKDNAARMITDRMYALGPSIVTYNCPGGGSPCYGRDIFNCTKFLERLRGCEGNGRWVNCADCAAVVSTFANSVGCNLAQSKMGCNFELRKCRPIGATEWELPCPKQGSWDSFKFHEVAWKPPCGWDDGVYDACLQVNANLTSLPPPVVGIQPADVTFRLYQPMVSVPWDKGECDPIGPDVRRPVR